MKLVFYLFDDTVDDFEKVFLNGKIQDEPYPFRAIPLREGNENIRVFLQANRPARPGWLDFFTAHCDFGGEPLRNQYNSLVVVFRLERDEDDRYIALTAGQWVREFRQQKYSEYIARAKEGGLNASAISMLEEQRDSVWEEDSKAIRQLTNGREPSSP